MVKKFVHKAKSAASDKFIVQSIRTMMLRVLGVMVLFGFTFFITNNYPARIVGQYDFVRSFLLIVGSLCLLGTDQSVLYYSGRLRSSNSIHELMSVYKKMLA
ncbi:MAG: polysaccharide biosynthesis protein, partial [Flavobacterium sp.]